MPYVKAAEWDHINMQLLDRGARIRELEVEVARNRAALADKMKVELERLGDGAVLWHFFEKPGERWTVKPSFTTEGGWPCPKCGQRYSNEASAALCCSPSSPEAGGEA